MSPSLQNAEPGAYAAALLAKSGTSPFSQPSLAALDGCIVAVQLDLPAGTQILTGRCTYQSDRQLGAVLRIELPASAMCELLIVEREFNGQIVALHEHGCQYLIRIAARSQVAD